MASKTKKSGFPSWLFIIVILGLVYWFFISPFIFLYNLRTDATNGNTESLRRKIDVIELRADLKSQINQSYKAKNADANDPISGLTNAIAPKIAEKLIDGLVTPNGIANVVKSGKLSQDKGEKGAKKPMPSIGMKWQNPNNVIVELKTKTDGAETKIGIQLERNDFINWKLTGLKLPENALTK